MHLTKTLSRWKYNSQQIRLQLLGHTGLCGPTSAPVARIRIRKLDFVVSCASKQSIHGRGRWA